MNTRPLDDWLTGLNLPDRAKVLARIAHALTLYARDLYFSPAAGKDKAAIAKELLGFSELQHKLTSQILHYLDGEQVKVYPVDVFNRILIEKAAEYEITPQLVASIRLVRQSEATQREIGGADGPR
jgi:hypothetical protein